MGVRLPAALLVVSFAVACQRAPIPPSPAGSASSSARAAVSSSPPASASANVVRPSCADWTVSDAGAKGSLVDWCRQFGPCPESLQQGVDRVPLFFSSIETRGQYRILRSGFLGGRRYTFESDPLVGAELWNDMPSGVCADRGVVSYTAGVVLPVSEHHLPCGVVPQRDYTRGEPCRCNVEVRKPTLMNGDQGPLLRTSLECLYEAGVAAHLCRPTLQTEREFVALQEKEAKAHAEIAAGMRRARGSQRPSAAEKMSLAQAGFKASERAECGGSVISSPYQGATVACRYDAKGALVGLRWGKRYESVGFAVCDR